MNHQLTSRKAFLDEVAPTLGARQITVLEAIDRLQECSNSELAIALDWTINRVTPRVNELRKAGVVVESTRRMCKVTGRTVIAWKIRGESSPESTQIAKPLIEFRGFSSRKNPDGAYLVRRVGNMLHCTCDGFRYRHTCMHVKHEEKLLEGTNPLI